jgi:C4-dicarboxylate-binding protein DctP
MSSVSIPSRRLVLKGALAAAASGSLAMPALAQAARPVMRISHQVPPAHHLVKMLAVFTDEVKRLTNDGIDIQVFGSEQLAKAVDNFPGVARGSFEAAISTNFQWGQTLPEPNAISIPFLISTLDQIRRFPASDARKLIDERLRSRQVQSLTWFYTTRQAIITSNRAPIVALEDFRGVKIRGFNALNDSGLRAIGAVPVAMPAPEVYQALQSGVLDSGLTDVSAAVSRRFYEVQKFGTVTPSLCVYFHMYCNPAWFGGLAKPLQEAITTASAKAESEAIAITEATADAAVGQLRSRGMTIHVQTPEEAAKWKAAMQPPVFEAFLKFAPEGGKRIIDLLSQGLA